MKLNFFKNPETMSTQVSTKNTVRFYTKEQISKIEESIALEIPLTKIAKKFAKEWDRPKYGMYLKVVAIYNKLNPDVAKSRKLKKKRATPQIKVIQAVETVAPVKEMELQMTEGSTFDCKPSRVTICKDHIRIYF